MRSRAKASDWAVFAALAALTLGAALYYADADFTYPDASRHATDAVFLLDAVAERPVHAPMQWAENYYTTSPALGIGRYPPLMAAVQVPFHAVLGPRPFAGRLAVALLWLAGTVLFYEALRKDLGRPGAAFAALVLAAGPGSLRWGGEVMLELPATALLMAAVPLYMRYLGGERRAFVTWAVVLVCLAGWVKQPAVLVLLPLALHLLLTRRPAKALWGELWPAFIAAVVFLAPLAALSARFGAANFMLLSGAARSYSLFSLGNWLYYIAQIPSYYLGLSFTAFAVLGLGCALAKKCAPNRLFWALWAAVFYFFFSLVGYKSARLTMFWTPALAYFAGVAFAWLVSTGRRRQPTMAVAAAVLSVASTAYFGLRQLPPRRMEIRAAAELALAQSPERILYAGARNGTFIFRIRELAGRSRPVVVRASKVFYVNVIQEELGRIVRTPTESDVRETVARIAPDIVVVETGWQAPYSSPASLRAFHKYLATADFELLHTISTGERAHEALNIFAYVGPRQPAPVALPMPGVGMELELEPAGD